MSACWNEFQKLFPDVFEQLGGSSTTIPSLELVNIYLDSLGIDLAYDDLSACQKLTGIMYREKKRLREEETEIITPSFIPVVPVSKRPKTELKASGKTINISQQDKNRINRICSQRVENITGEDYLFIYDKFKNITGYSDFYLENYDVPRMCNELNSILSQQQEQEKPASFKTLPSASLVLPPLLPQTPIVKALPSAPTLSSLVLPPLGTSVATPEIGYDILGFAPNVRENIFYQYLYKTLPQNATQYTALLVALPIAKELARGVTNAEIKTSIINAFRQLYKDLPSVGPKLVLGRDFSLENTGQLDCQLLNSKSNKPCILTLPLPITEIPEDISRLTVRDILVKKYDQTYFDTYLKKNELGKMIVMNCSCLIIVYPLLKDIINSGGDVNAIVSYYSPEGFFTFDQVVRHIVNFYTSPYTLQEISQIKDILYQQIKLFHTFSGMTEEENYDELLMGTFMNSFQINYDMLPDLGDFFNRGNQFKLPRGFGVYDVEFLNLIPVQVFVEDKDISSAINAIGFK